MYSERVLCLRPQTLPCDESLPAVHHLQFIFLSSPPRSYLSAAHLINSLIYLLVCLLGRAGSDAPCIPASRPRPSLLTCPRSAGVLITRRTNLCSPRPSGYHKDCNKSSYRFTAVSSVGCSVLQTQSGSDLCRPPPALNVTFHLPHVSCGCLIFTSREVAPLLSLFESNNR